MVLFPNCKINLGLRVIGKRADGYHDLDTIFYPLPLRDAAEINTAAKRSRQEFDLTITGLQVPGTVSENLCTKAWELIKNDYPGIPPLKMHLHKGVPPGAGLGGGSSNASFTLLLLNHLLKLQLSQDQLMAYALKLGSDCPFFFINKPCHATGRGEILKEISVELKDHSIVLVFPGIHINTGWAFSKLSESVKSVNDPVLLTEIMQQPVSDWKDQLMNDFELPVFKEHPLLRTIKDKLYDLGAEYASLTGTGSCVFGIFGKRSATVNIQMDESYKIYHLKPCY